MTAHDATKYSFMRKGNSIEFWSNDDKLVENVEDYIKRYIDAENWRRQFHQITSVKREEKTCQTGLKEQ